MKLIQHDTAYYFYILFIISTYTGAVSQDFRSAQEKAVRLPEVKFNFNEYSEYPDNTDRNVGPQAPQWSQMLSSNHNSQVQNVNNINNKRPTQSSETLDPNIEWDSRWASNLNLGQVSGVSLHPNGNIAVFHRGNRTWDQDTFNNENKFDPNKGPIKQNTILLLDNTGKKLLEWGKNMFYLPHGLTIDFEGNYWITDVALHQVLKFDASEIDAHWEDLKKDECNTELAQIDAHDPAALFKHSVIKPSLILGKAFEPGNDEMRFCKPTAVAVQLNGDFFVSDGYCNSRVIKFNKKGERILQWGRHWGIKEFVHQPPPPTAFFVPHALALADDLDYIFVADRENGRVSCFFASNGTFHKQYKHTSIGTKIYSVAYAQEKMFIINGPDLFANEPVHIRGFIIDINSGNILSQFAPQEKLSRPHDLAVSEDGSEIYIVDLDTTKIYRFLQKSEDASKLENTTHSLNRHKTAPLTDTNSEDTTSTKTTMTTSVLALVTTAVILITFCVAAAAVIARCQKRGRSYLYEEANVEFRKFVK